MRKLERLIFFAFCINMLLCIDSSFSNDLTKLPKLKVGGWEMSVKNQNMPAGMPSFLSEMKMDYCIDEATQENMITQAEDDGECDKPNVQKIGNKYISNFKCSVDGQSIHGNAETDFISDTQINNKVTMSGTGQPTLTITSNAKYIGACKSGMKPGDMRLLNADGSQLNLGNIEELKKMGEALSQLEQ